MRKGGSDSIGGFLAGYRRELTPDDSLQGQVMLGKPMPAAFCLPRFLWLPTIATIDGILKEEKEWIGI